MEFPDDCFGVSSSQNILTKFGTNSRIRMVDATTMQQSSDSKREPRRPITTNNENIVVVNEFRGNISSRYESDAQTFQR